MVALARELRVSRSRLYEWCGGRRREFDYETVRRLYFAARFRGIEERLHRALRAPKMHAPVPTPPALPVYKLRPRERGALTGQDWLEIAKAERRRESPYITGWVRVTADELETLRGKGWAGRIRVDGSGATWITSSVTLGELDTLSAAGWVRRLSSMLRSMHLPRVRRLGRTRLRRELDDAPPGMPALDPIVGRVQI